MRIAEGVAMLEISANVMGGVDTLHPTLLWDKDTVILVDTGYPGMLPKIREAIEESGVSYQKLNKIIITHQDLDHIGSLPAIVEDSHHPIEVLAHEIEKPYIQGEQRLLKITPETIEQAMQSIPKEVPEEWRKAFKAVLENPPKSKVDRTISDGETLPHCGGITVIHTPGHTPGHISLYHQPSRTLIAADELIVVNGQLHLSDPQQTLDMNDAIQSLNKLAQYKIETVVCYHGGIYEGNVSQRLAQLIAELSPTASL